MSLDLFPEQTPNYILSFQFSSWYPTFSDVSIKSTIVRPLSREFRGYLESESVFVPEGSEDVIAGSTLSDDEIEDEDEGDQPPSYAFPELDAKIRECIQEYGAVFPKLNFTSPRDAAWVLLASSPLKCTTPADVYLLLKSSDFVSHDLEVGNVFDGCTKTDVGQWPKYELELVLRKWYPMNPSRELRCFVRNGKLIGISQRDTNHYNFLNDPTTKERIRSSITIFWEETIHPRSEDRLDYTFDLLLTRDLSRGHIVDFNPYSPRTDSYLFSFEDLRDIATSNTGPEFRVIDSPSHPVAARNAPTHQHNMMPIEALHLSAGKSLEEFAQLWKTQLDESTATDLQ